MGRWSEAFHAYVQARDTADTADTSQQGSVDTVTSVMLPDDHDHEVLPQNSERVSPVSTVSRPAERKKSTAYGQTAFLGRAITEGYRQAALRRPPSSADPRNDQSTDASAPAARDDDGGASERHQTAGAAGHAIRQTTFQRKQ